MDKNEVLQIFKETKLMQKGHFLLTSGRHSDTYMQCARLFEYPKYSKQIAIDIANAFANDQIDLVVGPAIGGIILAYEVSKQLGVRNVFAERQESTMALRRGFEVLPKQRVLIVEDVITTGGSVVEVKKLLESLGAIVVGVGLVVDRSNGKINFGCKKYAVLTTQVISYEAKNCPICKSDIPLIKPGSRKLTE